MKFSTTVGGGKEVKPVIYSVL